MIPPDWTPHRRPGDDELVGYLVPAADGAVVPVTLFGFPLGPAGDEPDALERLDAEGMACLAEHWWLAGGLDGRGDAVRVRIQEVTPDRVSVLIDDFGAGGDFGARVELPVPEAGRLTRAAVGGGS